MLAVRARALLDGRLAPSIDDVLDLAEPVLKHRMALTFTARAQGETIEGVVGRLRRELDRRWRSSRGAPPTMIAVLRFSVRPAKAARCGATRD